MSAAPWHGQAQQLAAGGYPFERCEHRVLRIERPSAARRFLADLMALGWPTVAGVRPAVDAQNAVGVDIGFSYRGLRKTGAADWLLQVLRERAPAFAEGAPARATQRLGDFGPSAPAGWDPAFSLANADVVVSVHGNREPAIDNVVTSLRALDAGGGFDGWDSGRIVAAHLTSNAIRGSDRVLRRVHFGFRDNVTTPRIAPPDESAREPGQHAAGELLLGYPNDAGYNRWGGSEGPPASTQAFFRNASFGVLRQIEQDVHGFEQDIHGRVQSLVTSVDHGITADYLKAKMCGRWPDGAVVSPLDGFSPPLQEGDVPAAFEAYADRDGTGCPFGSHIRRCNPRADKLRPPQLRPLFRRGMPYGKAYAQAEDGASRGLAGLFFCASIEDQFETLMSEWVEKRPMVEGSTGRAKDPLIGHHNDADAAFHIPRADQAPIVLNQLRSYLTTRGTMYALYPCRAALEQLAKA